MGWSADSRVNRPLPMGLLTLAGMSALAGAPAFDGGFGSLLATTPLDGRVRFPEFRTQMSSAIDAINAAAEPMPAKTTRSVRVEATREINMTFTVRTKTRFCFNTSDAGHLRSFP